MFLILQRKVAKNVFYVRGRGMMHHAPTGVLENVFTLDSL